MTGEAHGPSPLERQIRATEARIHELQKPRRAGPRLLTPEEEKSWNPVSGCVPEPEPMPAEPQWPKLTAPAYHGLAGEIVRIIGPASEADPAALLLQFLVGFGNVLGRTVHFKAEADEHYGNEYVTLVGKSSKARKGSSWGRVLHILEEVDRGWANEHIQSGASSAEGLIHLVRDPVWTREKQKGEYVDVQSDVGVTDKRLLLYEPEFANVLKQAERQGNTLSACQRNAWDGRDLGTLTKTRIKATGAHISSINHITEDELRRYMTCTELANGFANRYLFACVKRSKVLPEGGHVDEAEIGQLAEQARIALGHGQLLGEIRRDNEARRLWADIYPDLSEGKPGMAGSVLGRAEAHVMRLSMIYAVLDLADAIGLRHLAAGKAVWDYCEQSVLYIFGDAVGDPLADDIHRQLKQAGKVGMTRSEIYTALGRHQSGEKIGRALGVLRAAKRARPTPEKTGGREAERWFAMNGTLGA